MAHAEIHADTHVFGSTRGYGTVASSRGVREDEARELESFQFGEASTADRIARLETHAVMTGRALRSGRFAISRMMPAGVDDAGRPTIEVVTLLVEARDYAACVGALPRLASDARFWIDARATAASGARLAATGAEPAPRDPQVLRLFDLWRGAVRHGAIGVVSESESDSVLRLVASLDPADLLRCRWGIGLLSVSAPADICSVASGVSMHGARDVMRPAQQGAWHCGSESEYAGFRAAALPTLPSVADIELNGHTLVVADDDGSVRASAAASPRREARERRVMPFAIGSAVLSTAVLAVAVVMHGRREVVAPVVLGGTKEPKAPTADGVERLDPLGAVIEPNAAAPAPSPSPATPPSTPPATAPSTPPPTTPSTPPATAPSTPPATAPSTPPATTPSTPPTPASGTPLVTEPTPLEVLQSAKRQLTGIRSLTPLTQREIDEAPNPNSANIWSSISEASLRDGRKAAEAIAQLINIDQIEKRKAKEKWPKDSITKAWTSIETTNGFINSFPANGPGGQTKQNDALLRRDLVKVWVEILNELDRIMPQGSDQSLVANWDAGVDEYLEAIPRTEVYYKEMKLASEFVKSASANSRRKELSRANRLLGAKELVDGGAEPSLP